MLFINIITNNMDSNIQIPDSSKYQKENENDPYFLIEEDLNVIVLQNYLSKYIADYLFELLLKIEYRSDYESMVKIGGKLHFIPRKQIAFGKKGTTYDFTGTRCCC